MGFSHSIPNSTGVFFCYFFWVPSFIFAAFLPVDNFLIDCGGAKPLKVDDGRTFEPDSGNGKTGFSVSPASSIVVSETVTTPSNIYQTCRVFTETSTYTFHTKKVGRHWLRLYLFPIENPRYNLTAAVFTVEANGITLLHEFSFAELGKRPSHLCEEFVVHVDLSRSKDLVLTLYPSKASLAFINGIEVMSVPDGQFPSTAAAIPGGSSLNIPAYVALRTAYRINMGGPLINPKNDSLWRTWEPDYPFLLNSASGRNVSINPSLIRYPAGVSVEIAPYVIYATAQEMADANVNDPRFNVSWAFKVDGGFKYLIRLHFCDIVSKALNNLIFDVYINNQTALNSFDISSKTMELYSAYFVDFAADVLTSSNQILVQIGPPNLRNTPSNAILNGLEIIRLSNAEGSLDVLPGAGFGPRGPKKNIVIVASVICLAGFAILALVAAAFYLHFHKSRKPQKQPSSAWLPLPTHVGHSESKISNVSYASTAASLGLGRVLAFSEIREATKNFDENLVIGLGGFGKVYRGVLDNGEVVAVKRGNPRSQQGLTEFRTEIEMLSKLRHRHLVSLIGYCEELNEMILVYEFMAGGPLRTHLYGSNLPPLTWKQRLEICIGAAKGLHYLHTGAAESVIHRDVKTTNILLDENLIAKVADFGLSKLGPTLDQTHVSTAVKGSFGYLDPEYFRRQQLTEKSDVYSFGVVLMEVLCARPAINPSLPREQVNIAEWAMHWQKKGQLDQIIDPHLVGNVKLESLRKFGETAEKCLSEYGIERPTMGDVLWNLEYALQLQEAALQTVADENSTNYIPEIPEWIPHIVAADCESADIVSDQGSDATTTSAVFSQLMNPSGR